MIFQQLLNTNINEFFKKHWENNIFFSKTSLHCNEIAAPLQEWSDELLQEILDQGTILAAKNSQKVGNKFFLDTSSTALTAVEKLRFTHDEGFTIYIQSIEKHCQSIKAIADKLEEELAPMAPQFNLFLTPPGQIGLNPHFDCHDSIIWQLSGEKTWRFWPAHTQAMTSHHPNQIDVEKTSKITSLEAPIFTKTLSKNDVVYLPRGVIHAPQAVSYSIHMTIWLQSPLRETITSTDETQFFKNQSKDSFF